MKHLKIPHYNILLVEDEPMLIRSLRRMISELDMGFVVAYTAGNGLEAIKMMEENDIHLIISDIVMPLMSGLEFLHEASKRRPNTPVIMLSGHADFSFAQQALRSGAIDYLLKPITIDKIDSALIGAKLKLENYYRLIEDETLSGQTAEQAVEYACVYLKEKFAEPVEISNLAKRLGFSSAYLTKLFKKYMHCTPVKYLTELRIAEAKNLLYNTNLTIKEIGERVGYDNQFYFSRVFHKTVDKTPSEYRERRN
ncbi:MAG: response regulator [Oscillospiraceae bacterium]|nr:response regulator [Oscillospiraceae bacterium]